jgi:hypothetical protein
MYLAISWRSVRIHFSTLTLKYNFPCPLGQFFLSVHASHAVRTGGCICGEIEVGFFEFNGKSPSDAVVKIVWRYTSTP